MLESKTAELLLVDDRPENLFILENILMDLDCQLFRATSGQEALRLMLRHDFALVLLDVQMPGMDGFEVAELMRGNKDTQETPIIFITAISKEERYVFKGYEVGAVDYLPKPVDSDILRSKVKVFLEMNRQKKLLEVQAIELEQKMRALEDEIIRRQKVEQELRQAKKTAETATQAKSIFLARMNHELRTPLNAMIGYMSLGLSMLKDQISPDDLKDLINAERSANVVLQLVNNILDFSKIEAGEMEIFVEEIDLADLIEDIEITAQGLLLHKPVELKTEISFDAPFVANDYTKIKQILNNLVGNAIKFTTEGSVIIRLKSPEDGTSARIEVEDTGKGIPKEQLGDVFESFKQADGSISKEFGGTGLGLAITKSLCEMLGIEIGVQSEIGQGTMFWFHIPVHFYSDGLEDMASTTTAAMQEFESGQSIFEQSEELMTPYSILLIDDDVMNLDLMEDIFNAKGATVYKALLGQEGLDIAFKEFPDVIIMDLLMPGIDGFEATRILKQDPRTTKIPIISCTAVSTKEFREEALQAGCVVHIVRPIKPRELVRQIEKFVLASKTN